MVNEMLPSFGGNPKKGWELPDLAIFSTSILRHTLDISYIFKVFEGLADAACLDILVEACG